MFYLFLILFILIPAIEIGVFIWTGGALGVLPVISLIILTGIVGAMLMKQQGIETWRKAQLAMYNREVPHKEILDGICIIAGGILLLTPGFVTDTIGFLLVLPWTRPPFRHLLNYFLLKQVQKGTFIFRRW
ncbi:MAG TPA: FxsA family protein [Pseudogracilibacillus sp.]|nr:FxsA family protein [Pseudogracilibacillus sp.]